MDKLAQQLYKKMKGFTVQFLAARRAAHAAHKTASSHHNALISAEVPNSKLASALTSMRYLDETYATMTCAQALCRPLKKDEFRHDVVKACLALFDTNETGVPAALHAHMHAVAEPGPATKVANSAKKEAGAGDELEELVTS